MNSSRLIRMLLDNDWKLVRITGSHHHFRHPGSNKVVTVPHPREDVPVGTYRSVLKHAGLLDRLYS